MGITLPEIRSSSNNHTFTMEDTTTKSTVAKDETQMCRDALSRPSSYGWQPSLLYNQHFGLPPFLDFRDLSWMESVFRKLRTSSWPGYTQASGFAPQLGLTVHRVVGGGVSEVMVQQNRWTVSLDVNHFAPSEIMVRTQGGFLEIEGKHDERQDEHGYISRCFLRKYELPAGIEAQSIHSFVTGDGVLTVEAMLPNIAPPADATIPVQVEIEAPILKGQKQDGRQPGVSDIADTPKGDTVGTGERIRDPSGLPDAPERSVERGEETIVSQQDGKRKKEEKVDESAGATEEVLDSKPRAPEVPKAPDTMPFERESGIQEKKKDGEIRGAEVEGDVPSAEAEGEVPVSVRTKDEIPSKMDVKGKQAVEQMEHVK